MRISDAHSDSNSELGVPIDYIRTKLFFEHFRIKSWEQFTAIPYELYIKKLKYSEAEVHGQKRANAKK